MGSGWLSGGARWASLLLQLHGKGGAAADDGGEGGGEGGGGGGEGGGGGAGGAGGALGEAAWLAAWAQYASAPQHAWRLGALALAVPHRCASPLPLPLP